MLYNRCTGICKFGNNAYPRRIRRRLNLGHIFREKSASYGPGNTVFHSYHKTHWPFRQEGQMALSQKLGWKQPQRSDSLYTLNIHFIS